MKVSLLAVVLATLPSAGFASPAVPGSVVQEKKASTTATYTDAFLGLSFDHPKAWKVLRKQKDGVKFEVPIPNSPSTAELEVIRTAFHSSKEIWNTIQTRANETMGREIIRNWEQDILEVPMLFTQVNWSDKGTAKTTLSGLYYTRTPMKLLIRLTAPINDFDSARFQLQTALETLRTVDGSQPQIDDEAVKFDNLPKKPVPVPPKPKVISAPTSSGADFAGPVSVETVASTKPVTLRLPEGWTGEAGEEGVVVLKHSELSAPLRLEMRSTLDSEPAITALLKLSYASLADFKSVTKREDRNPESNRAGCEIGTVLRLGKSNTGDLAIFQASGSQGNFYFLTTYRQPDLSLFKVERKRIEDLLSQIRLQPGNP